ncbi:hypothetical protein L1049_018565 [Liquidambar formosana]|uniref:Protein transport protein sec16 n=1 Tax=Liquidambar formosana TaxID=63359 RepID=A0AAP0RAU9_LIQFO
MASPPFELEDQTDEDFFNKLVDDEIDCTRSGPSFVDGSDSDEAKAFSNLSIDEVGPTGVDSGGGDGHDVGLGVESEEGIVAVSSDAHEGNLVGKESNSSTLREVGESSDVAMGSEGSLDGTIDSNNVMSETGVKVVAWSSFHSDSHFHSGSGLGSSSDFFSEFGDSVGDPFVKAVDTVNSGAEFKIMDGVLDNPVADVNSFSSIQNQEGQYYGANAEQTVDGHDLSSSQYWENLYPGWRYDPNTGEWHQLDGYDANENVNMNANAQESSVVSGQSAGGGVVSAQGSDVHYLQQTAQSIAGSVAEATTGSVSNWNQVSQGNAEYPAHMIFDPQYPGWYYDMIAQKWELLESYTPAVNQPTSVDHNQKNQNANISTGHFFPENNYSSHDKCEQVGKFGSQDLSSQGQVVDWAGSVNNYSQQNMAIWQPEPVAQNKGIGFTENQHFGNLYGEPAAQNKAFGFTENQQFGNLYGSSGHVNNSTYQQTGYKPSETVAVREQTSQSLDGANRVVGFQSFLPAENFSQHHNQSKMDPTQQMHFAPAYFESQKPATFSQQPLQSGTQFSHASSVGRSSAGRPPHALVTFGFGGRLIVMKDSSSLCTNSAYGSQDPVRGVVNVLNLMEVVRDNTDASSIGLGACDYFHSLCQQSFPGPLVGGNVGSRELNKWIDDKIANCEYPNTDYRKGYVLRLLFSLLKIACQYYGKLRSPFGSDEALKESDCPESAIAKLFASTKINGAQSSEYGALTRCLQNFPSEGQIQATAVEVQKLLVSGRKKEALQYAQEGQLWGPALVLASQLGDQFYGDTVKQMALHQFVAGSPLRTLCLLIAGQPADVFTNVATSSSLPGDVNIFQQPIQTGSNSMLDKWEENLAIITANRTKDDELVIIHLGDCLWKEGGEVTAAHICYLVAEANFESYSDSARLCLIGADHWKFPRTYASPEAIQRTELYEYSKVIGNSQFIVLPFQPYKLIYAHMLAEVGKLSDSLKYCQAILKSLKTGRAPEVDTWKQMVLSLEERIRTHQQGGYGTNLDPTKLVGKLLNFFDSTAHRVVGGLPPPIPSSSHSSVQRNEHVHQLGGPIVSNSQSTMAMSSLMPSASMEPISEWSGGSDRLTVPNRSISEPDFGKAPRKEANSSDTQGKASSRFGRFGSQIIQKTVGLVLRSRPDRQAKLGEKNKFYYDEKLKRWVEEGVEPPAEETVLPPPPTTAVFQNGMPDYNIKDTPNERLHINGGPEIKSPISSEQSPGIPPIPPSSNQFSARGRMGVRSRYVDTFNKGGGAPANLFQSPSIPSAKPGGGSNPKFFVPTPAASGEETAQLTGESLQEGIVTNENPPASSKEYSFSSPPTSTSSSMTMQRFPSMDNIVHRRMGGMANDNSSLHPPSRRAASWSGSLNDANNPSKMAEIKPLGEALGMHSSSFMPSNPPSMRFSTSGSSFGEDLHEVEL